MKADPPVRLCVVSRDRLQSGVFIAALRESLRPQDQLEIVMDRRHGRASARLDLTEDRRRQPTVDLALEVHGFAIIPASGDATPIPLLLPETEIHDFRRDDNAHEKPLESPRPVERGRTSWRLPMLLAVPVTVALAAFTLSSVGPDLRNSLLSPGRSTAPLPTTTEPTLSSPAPPPVPSAAEPAAAPTTAPSPASDRPIAIPGDTSPPPRVTGSPSRLTSAARKDARPKRTLRRATKEIVSAPSPGEPTPKATPRQPVGSARVELARQPTSLGWGESYALRLLDPSGLPLGGATVELVAHRADGSVDSIPMGALPEHGTYRGTVPTGESVVVDLRVRVTTGDRRVELPVPP